MTKTPPHAFISHLRCLLPIAIASVALAGCGSQSDAAADDDSEGALSLSRYAGEMLESIDACMEKKQPAVRLTCLTKINDVEIDKVDTQQAKNWPHLTMVGVRTSDLPSYRDGAQWMCNVLANKPADATDTTAIADCLAKREYSLSLMVLQFLYGMKADATPSAATIAGCPKPKPAAADADERAVQGEAGDADGWRQCVLDAAVVADASKLPGVVRSCLGPSQIPGNEGDNRCTNTKVAHYAFDTTNRLCPALAISGHLGDDRQERLAEADCWVLGIALAEKDLASTLASK